MTRKYGPDIKWFDVVCMRKDCFKLKAFEFKANLGVILRNTEHANCANTVAAFFPKVHLSLYKSIDTAQRDRVQHIYEHN